MENNGKPQSPHVIKIDLDSDSSQPPTSRPSSAAAASVKNITIGQITDSVIAKDFASSSSSMLSHRPPYGSMYHSDSAQPPHVSMGAPDHQWVRRLPPGAIPVSQASGKDPKDMSSSASSSSGRVPTPDDRQIIRMAQTPSPRAKSNTMPIHEPVSPPDDNSGLSLPPVPLPSHYYSSVGQTSISLQPVHGGPSPSDRRPNSGPPAGSGSSSGPPTSSHQSNFVLDCYVKNRIVEEMRIQEKAGGVLGQTNPNDRSSTPGGNDEMRPNSRPSGPPLGHPYGAGPNPSVATTVAYPYSAWTMSGAPGGNHVAQPPKVGESSGVNSSGAVNSANASIGPPAEPKPLLSSQYEELSDEDDGHGN